MRVRGRHRCSETVRDDAMSNGQDEAHTQHSVDNVPESSKGVPREAWVVLFASALCMSQSGLALSITNVAFPSIRDDFPTISTSTLSWVINLYTIMAGASLIVSGVIVTKYGPRRMLLVGAGLFAVAALACGLAPNIPLLLVARAFQAFGSALSTPAGIALLVAAFPDSHRATAVTGYTAAGQIAAALGPSLGGFLVDAGGWRWAFFAMAPSGSIGMLLILKFVKEDRRAMTDARPDIPGAALIMVSMSLIIGGLVQSRPWGWSDPRVIFGILLGAVLIAYLVQRSRNREFPILDLSLFKFATFRSSNVGTLVFGTGFFIVFFGYVLFLTDVWDYSARDAGILLTPLALCGAIMAPITARFLRTRGTETLLIPGGVLFTAGALIMFFAAGDEPNILGVWLPSILLTGIGSGIAWPCLYAGVVAEVSANQYAAASGLNQTIQRMSTALGVAIAAVLLGDTIGQTSVGHFDRIFIASGLCGAAAAILAALIAQKPRLI